MVYVALEIVYSHVLQGYRSASVERTEISSEQFCHSKISNFKISLHLKNKQTNKKSSLGFESLEWKE